MLSAQALTRAGPINRHRWSCCFLGTIHSPSHPVYGQWEMVSVLWWSAEAGSAPSNRSLAPSAERLVSCCCARLRPAVPAAFRCRRRPVCERQIASLWVYCDDVELAWASGRRYASVALRNGWSSKLRLVCRPDVHLAPCSSRSEVEEAHRRRRVPLRDTSRFMRISVVAALVGVLSCPSHAGSPAALKLRGGGQGAALLGSSSVSPLGKVRCRLDQGGGGLCMCTSNRACEKPPAVRARNSCGRA